MHSIKQIWSKLDNKKWSKLYKMWVTLLQPRSYRLFKVYFKSAKEEWRSSLRDRCMAQDGLMGRKEVLLTSILHLQGPFFHLTHVLHMFPAKCCAVKGFCSCSLHEGLWICSFHLFEFAAPYCPGFLNSHPVVKLSPHNCLGALHPGLEVLPQVYNFGSFIGSSCFSLSLVQWLLKVPNCLLPFEAQRPFNWKHMIDS